MTTATAENDQNWLLALFDQMPATEVVYVAPKAKKACPKCNGSGYISIYSHIKGGECFACNGRGTK